MGSGVEPSKSSPHGLHHQSILSEILLIDTCDFKFPACAWSDCPCNIKHIIRIEIQSHNGIVALWGRGFLLYGHTLAAFVELYNAIAFRVVDPIAEYTPERYCSGGWKRNTSLSHNKSYQQAADTYL